MEFGAITGQDMQEALSVSGADGLSVITAVGGSAAFSITAICAMCCCN